MGIHSVVNEAMRSIMKLNTGEIVPAIIPEDADHITVCPNTGAHLEAGQDGRGGDFARIMEAYEAAKRAGCNEQRPVVLDIMQGVYPETLNFDFGDAPDSKHGGLYLVGHPIAIVQSDQTHTPVNWEGARFGMRNIHFEGNNDDALMHLDNVGITEDSEIIMENMQFNNDGLGDSLRLTRTYHFLMMRSGMNRGLSMNNVGQYNLIASMVQMDCFIEYDDGNPEPPDGPRGGTAWLCWLEMKVNGGNLNGKTGPVAAESHLWIMNRVRNYRQDVSPIGGNAPDMYSYGNIYSASFFKNAGNFYTDCDQISQGWQLGTAPADWVQTTRGHLTSHAPLEMSAGDVGVLVGDFNGQWIFITDTRVGFGGPASPGYIYWAVGNWISTDI